MVPRAHPAIGDRPPASIDIDSEPFVRPWTPSAHVVVHILSGVVMIGFEEVFEATHELSRIEARIIGGGRQ